MTTVSVVTNDPTLFRNVVATLGGEYNVVGDDPADAREPDLILRHWADRSRHVDGTAATILAVDLSLLSGDSLVNVVDRVLHGRCTRVD